MGIGIFIAGVIVGWINPIEGPLDWTYDEYASRPAHKTSSRVAPIPIEQKLPILWLFIDEDELFPSSSIIQGVVMEENKEE